MIIWHLAPQIVLAWHHADQGAAMMIAIGNLWRNVRPAGAFPLKACATA